MALASLARFKEIHSTQWEMNENLNGKDNDNVVNFDS